MTALRYEANRVVLVPASSPRKSMRALSAWMPPMRSFESLPPTMRLEILP
jgi:hypothetical protein